MGRLDLGEALELTALICLRDPPRGERYARRWLARWIEETPHAAIGEVVLVVGALAALGSPAHDQAILSLRATAKKRLGRAHDTRYARRVVCAECGVEADRVDRGWRAYRLDQDDEEPELGFFCPECWAREFDWQAQAEKPAE